MSERRFRYSGEEAHRMARKWYDCHILPAIGATSHGKYVAIDVETGEYEVGDDSLEANLRLLNRRPHAHVWMERVGCPPRRIGSPKRGGRLNDQRPR